MATRARIGLLAAVTLAAWCPESRAAGDSIRDAYQSEVGRPLAVCEHDGVLYVGGEKGLYGREYAAPAPAKVWAKFDPARGELAPDGDGKAVRVWCLLSASDALWVGTEKGLFRLNRGWPAPKLTAVKDVVRGLHATWTELRIGVSDRVEPPRDFCLYRWPFDRTTPESLNAVKTGNVASFGRAGDDLLVVGGWNLLRWEPTRVAPEPVAGFAGQPLAAMAVINRTWWQSSEAAPNGASRGNTPYLLRAYLSGPDNRVQTYAGLGAVNRFCVAGGALWVGAKNGLYRVPLTADGAAAAEPGPVSLARDAGPDGQGVNDLCVCGDRLWVAADWGVARIDGADGGGWAAAVTPTEDATAPPWLVLPDTGFRLTWRADSLGRRATPELVRWQATLRPATPSLPATELKISPAPDGRGGWAAAFGPFDAGEYVLEIRAVDLHDRHSPPLEVPLRVRSWGWLSGLVGTAVVVPAVLFVTLWYVPLLRGVYALVLGYRWHLADDPCEYEFAVRPSGRGFQFSLHAKRPTTPTDPEVIEPGADGALRPTAWLDEYRSALAGEDVRVVVDPTGFRYPWAHLLDSWEQAGSATVAGQLLLGQEPPKDPGLPPRWRLWFAGLGCYQPYSGGQDSLDEVAEEVARVTDLWRRVGAKVDVVRPAARDLATAQDLRDALAAADVVHVSAHALQDRIELADGAFTASDVDALARPRCRLLVLSACHLGDIGTTPAPIAAALVRRGVSVLASRTGLGDNFARVFFSALYEALLPLRRLRGVGLGTAIRAAAAAWQADPGADADAAGLSELVLYGDPKLRFQFTRGGE